MFERGYAYLIPLSPLRGGRTLHAKSWEVGMLSHREREVCVSLRLTRIKVIGLEEVRTVYEYKLSLPSRNRMRLITTSPPT